MENLNSTWEDLYKKSYPDQTINQTRGISPDLAAEIPQPKQIPLTLVLLVFTIGILSFAFMRHREKMIKREEEANNLE